MPINNLVWQTFKKNKVLLQPNIALFSSKIYTQHLKIVKLIYNWKYYNSWLTKLNFQKQKRAYIYMYISCDSVKKFQEIQWNQTTKYMKSCLITDDWHPIYVGQLIWKSSKLKSCRFFYNPKLVQRRRDYCKFHFWPKKEMILKLVLIWLLILKTFLTYFLFDLESFSN